MQILTQEVYVPVERSRVVVSQSFADFYLQSFTRLVVLATAVAGEATFAEDIVQDAMGKAHKQWATVGGYDNPGAWVRRAVINQAIDRKRRIVREAKALTQMGRTVPAVAFLPKSHPELWAAVNELPPRQRAAIALFYLEGYSTAEIADALDCADATARTALHRARTRLRERLTPSYGSEWQHATDGSPADVDIIDLTATTAYDQHGERS